MAPVSGDRTELTTFVKRLDRLAYGLRILGIGADKRAVRFQKLLQMIRSGQPLDVPGSPIELTRDEQRLILYNLRNIHARSQLTCKLVLLRLNDLLAGAPQQLDRDLTTVEHVLPLRPGRASQWREWFATPEAREACTQSLGNLVLLPRDRNERAKNLELRQKHDIFFSDGRDGVPHITRDLFGVKDWRPDEVLAREERLLTALCDQWQLSGWKVGPSADEQRETVSGQQTTRAMRRA